MTHSKPKPRTIVATQHSLGFGDEIYDEWTAGGVLCYCTRFRRVRACLCRQRAGYGAAFLERALLINPNLAVGWVTSGYVKLWLGERDRAIERFAHAMRLSPIDPNLFLMQLGIAHAHFFAGRYNEALSSIVLTRLESASSQPSSFGDLLLSVDDPAKRLASGKTVCGIRIRDRDLVLSSKTFSLAPSKRSAQRCAGG
jgi:tetratricopeptide (TPR) repeat protein